MFDESTSAIDTTTEASIYRILNELHIWYVTISHRSSLTKYHQKELQLYSPTIHKKENEFSLTNAVDINLPVVEKDSIAIEVEENAANETQQFADVTANNPIPDSIEAKTSVPWLKQVKDVWKLIHLPFGPNDRKLRIQVGSFLGRNQDRCQIPSLSRPMRVGAPI